MTRLFCLALAALLFAACDDPSNVGLGLVGDEGSSPTIARTGLPLTPLDRIERTGNADQSLAGTTADPILGTITAAAYLDFGAPRVLNANSTVEGFRSTAVSGVTLDLPISYRYGDTLSTVRYALRSIDTPFNAVSAPSDTSFAAGEVITTFEASASASVVTVTLPDEWVARLDTTLRGDSFLDSFNGFYVEPLSGNAVLGFRQFSPTSQSLVALTARSAADTVRFVANAGATTISRSNAPPLAQGNVLVQDGFRHALTVDLSDSSLIRTYRNVGLARIAVELPTLSVLESTGSYVRPSALPSLELVALTATDADVVNGGVLLLQVRPELIDGTLRFSSPRLQQLLQRTLLGDTQCFDTAATNCFGRLGFRFTPASNTIGAFVLTGEARAALTIIPTD